MILDKMEKESDEDPTSEPAMHRLGDGIAGKGHSPCKGPGADPVWHAGQTQETCVAGAEWVTEREGGGESRKGTGQVLQGLVGFGEDSGFNLETSLESFKAG